MKLRPDLQALVDVELARRDQEREAFRQAVKEGRAWDEMGGRPLPTPVEPYFVPSESPLIDAINVDRAVRARTGWRASPTARGMPWPEHVPFPREAVVPPQIDRDLAERRFESAAGGEREILLSYWRNAPWLAENYGGRLDFGPDAGLVIQRRARGVAVLGVGVARDVVEYTDYTRRGKVDVGGATYRVRTRCPEELFEYNGLVYAVPVLEVLGKVRASK